MRKNVRYVPLIIILINIFSLQNGVAQKNFIPGYIIESQGDTTQGLIDYRDWNKNPDRIHFKTCEECTQKIFTPHEIDGFGVSESIYTSAIVKKEVSPYRIERLNTNSEMKFEMDTVFLQSLIKGKKSLYYYKGDLDRLQFYIKKDLDFELLAHKRYLKKKGGSWKVINNNRYIGQLLLYLEDCKNIRSKVNNTDYKRNELETLFKKYYKCVDHDIHYKQESEKILINFDIIGGLSLTTVNFNAEIEGYLSKTDYSTSPDITTGIGLDIILPKNNGKWMIRNELIYQSYEVEGEIDDAQNPTAELIKYSRFGFSYLKLNSMVRYNHPVGKFKLLVDGGFSSGMGVGTENYLKTEYNEGDTHTVSKGNALDEIEFVEFSFIGGIGGRYKDVSLNLRYELGSGPSGYETISSSSSRFYIIAGYQF